MRHWKHNLTDRPDEPPCGSYGMTARSLLMIAVGTPLNIGVYEAFHRMMPGRGWLAVALTMIVGLPVCHILARWIVHRGQSEIVTAVSDGLLALSERDYSLRLAVERRDEMGVLVYRFNKLALTLRRERNDIYQRQLLLETVLGATSMIAIIFNEASRIIYSNNAARQFFGGGRRIEGRELCDLLTRVPAEVTAAVNGPEDLLFTCESGGGEPETFRISRHPFEISTQPHTLLLLRPLTKELERKEVETWKKAIRVLSHEVNNSLAPVSSLLHSARMMLGQPAHAQRLAGALDTIEERATHLKTFLDGYASFARLPAPTRRPVALCDLLAGVTGLYPFRVAGEIPARQLSVDPAQLQQVLINLLKNAAESGSAPDEILVELDVASRDGVELRVLDRGKGMSDEVLKNALLPFYSTKRSGSGIGLSLCREIVDAHGGRLTLHRRDGGGMAVRCWLPTPASAAPN